MSPAAQIDLQAAADEVGVHYQTAYRWVREGRLPAHLVLGRYSIERADLDAFIAERSAPTAPRIPTAQRLDTAATSMHQALVDGEEATARDLARTILRNGASLSDLIQQVITPPLRQIGQDWHDGNLSIWVEHRASSITERILGDVVPNPRGRRRGTAVVAAVSGDRHSLATTMAAVTLRDNNWNVHHLGADMPPPEIESFCSDHDLDVAVISLTNPDAHQTAHDLAARLEDSGLPVIVGAPGRTLEELVGAAAGALTTSRSQH